MISYEAGEGGIHIPDIAGNSDDWHQMAQGIQIRVLRTCQATGTWAVLYKVAAGTTASPHVHYGSADSLVLKGKMQAASGVDGGRKTLKAGDYAFEPNTNRRHEATYFVEDTLLLYIHTGALMYLDDEGNYSTMTDVNAIEEFLKRPRPDAETPFHFVENRPRT